MPPRPAPLPEGLGPIFTPEQARAFGVSARRLRAKDIGHTHRGALVSLPDVEELQNLDQDAPFARDNARHAEMRRRAELYRPVMLDDAFFIGASAAGFHGLPVDCSGPLEVGIRAPRRATRRRGIRGQQIAPHLVRLGDVDGFRVTDPATTWAMLAETQSVRELVKIGDAIVRVPRDQYANRCQESALGTVQELRDAVDMGRRRGIQHLRDALEHIRVGSASPLETDYRLDAEADGLPTPTLDVEVRDARGRLLGVTEVGYLNFRVLVEIEGDHHRTSREQWRRDIEKYAAYAAEGYEVVRLLGTHIRGRSPVATEMVKAALRRHGWRP
ncbi:MULTISPECIES: hypothetical protein [unclassified Microbacterium]|uniref:hypothetical protein n=1 Tax=unclassified Microbacterium TaxID=2609290 RepID=UPI0012FC8285|nr:hypothetical protein [Microbacterium sp. MAH-37]MVQ41205.1 hypothetical protein [Microbacterium sp. MAH-37]